MRGIGGWTFGLRIEWLFFCAVLLGRSQDPRCWTLECGLARFGIARPLRLPRAIQYRFIHFTWP